MQHAQPWLPSNAFRICGVKDQGCHCCWQGTPMVSAGDLLKVHLHAHFPEAASLQSEKTMSGRAIPGRMFQTLSQYQCNVPTSS